MAAFSDEQYKFVVEKLAEGEAPDAIAILVNIEWEGGKFTARDVAKLSRRHLNAEWAAYFDAWRAGFETEAPNTSFIVAWLHKKAAEIAGRNGSSADVRAYVELAEKIRSGFFAGKATGGAQAIPDDPLAKGGELVVRRTIVDPKESNEPGDRNSDAAGIRPAASAEAV